MVEDPGNNKPRDIFHKRVLESYHKRQKNYNELIDKSWSNSSNTTTATTMESSSKVSSSSSVVEVALKYGFISMIGRRRVMEDAIKTAVKLGNNKFIFFGAYDGHGGSRVSHACRDRMHFLLEEELLKVKRNANNDDDDDDNDSVDWEKVMVTCFSRMDEEVMRGGNRVGGYEEGGFEDVTKTVGFAAVVVVVGKEEIVVASCGDCRAILCSRGTAIPLSHDHKPDRPDEKKRVEAAGGKILNLNGSRVQGVLPTSRSIGDHCLKPFVIAEAEVSVYKRNKLDEFIVIGTDGLWDVVSNDLTCEIVRKSLDGQTRRRFPERDSAAEAAALLAELAIAKGSKDNVSVIVVELSS